MIVFSSPITGFSLLRDKEFQKLKKVLIWLSSDFMNFNILCTWLYKSISRLLYLNLNNIYARIESNFRYELHEEMFWICTKNLNMLPDKKNKQNKRQNCWFMYLSKERTLNFNIRLLSNAYIYQKLQFWLYLESKHSLHQYQILHMLEK